MTGFLQYQNLYGNDNDNSPDDGQGEGIDGTLFTRHRRVLRFIPYILLDCQEFQIDHLPSMTWMERATFYSEFVRVTDLSGFTF